MSGTAGLLRALPEVASHLPAPERLESVHISSDGSAHPAFVSLTGVVTALKSLLSNLSRQVGTKPESS